MSFFKNPFKSNTSDCNDTVDFNVVPSFEKNDLQGKNGENGKSITIINSYINPDGNTIIKFSDGSSIIVNKGLKGDTGDKGDKGDDGETISIVSTDSTVGPTGTIIEINFSDNSKLTFFVQRGETGNNGQDGIYITEAIIDTNSLSVTYGHLIITLSNASVIDAGYVLGGLTGIAGGELDGTYPNPNLKNSAVIGKVLTGLSLATGGVIAATDSILQAFGKLQKQITDGIPSGTINQYIRGDGSLATFPTALPPSGVAGGELSGTYPNPTLVTTAVTSKLLFGLPLFSNTPITSADSILSAFSKIQGQINNIPSLPSFTTGSVLFGSGTGITENNSKFFWNNVFKTLIIGSNTITPTNEQLIIYNEETAKALLSGVQGADLILKSTLLTDRHVTLRSGTLGAQLFSSSNVSLSLFIQGRGDGIVLDIDGRNSLLGGLATNIRYVNVDSLTVNIAKNENFVLINAGVITGITGATPLTIILPETPLDGQEVSFGVCNGTSGITLGNLEILIQGFGGTSIVINQLPELNGSFNNGISSATYKYSSSIGRWFRIN